MNHTIRRAALAAAILSTARATTITYEEVNLGAQGFMNNQPYAAAGVTHGNSFTDWGGGFTSWSGFAIANHADTTTPGYGNQYSAYAGGGADNSAQFAVGYIDTFFAPDGTRLAFATNLDLTGRGAWFTNTSYTALDLLGGSAFTKKFGGASGDDPDWLLLTLTGYLNQTATGSVALYLADYRFANNSLDYILDDWLWLDFAPLGTVDEIVFRMSSSDNGLLGMNTPAYFAMDDLVVPEPSAGALVALAGLAVAARRKRR